MTEQHTETGSRIALLLGLVLRLFDDMNDLDLLLAILVKCSTLLSFAVFILLNYPRIKTRIKQELNLTASAGIAPNKFLAKLASDLKKPDGFMVITEQNKQQILDPLPVSKIWGIGKTTNKALEYLGIKTIKQLRTSPVKTLSLVFQNQTDDILKLAQGIDNRQVETDTDAKSISAEEAFSIDITDKESLLRLLQNQVEQVSQRLRAQNLQARTITLKLRYGDFRTITRSSTMDKPTNTTEILLQEAVQVFNKWYKM